MKIPMLVAALIAWLGVAMASAQEANPRRFSFAGENSMEGWSKTQGATVTPTADHLEIQASDWDSKIYRSMTLPAGECRLSASGAGITRIDVVMEDWSKPIATVNFSGGSFRTNERAFDFPGGPIFLVVHAFGDKALAKIQWVELVFEKGGKSELPVAGASKTAANPADFKILFVGNSITRHGFNADTIKNLKWDHIAGMAATREEKDYAHTLAALIQESMPSRKVTMDFTSLIPGGNGSADERLAPVKPFASGKYDLVIIQHGEHEQQAKGVDALKGTYEKLVSMFSGSSQQIVICVGVWSPPWGKGAPGGSYSGWSEIVQDAMRQIAGSHGFPFVSVEDLAMDPANHGWGGQDGVRWHPNDRGHQGYANKIFEAFKSELAKRSLK